jgi:uncharacterized protein (TIGR03435 family)
MYPPGESPAVFKNSLKLRHKIAPLSVINATGHGRMKAVCMGTTLLRLAARSTFAQPAVKPLTFEAASIKPSGPNTFGATIRFLPGEGLLVSGASLKALIVTASGVRDFQIPDGPGRISSERFDVSARPETSDSPESSQDEQRKALGQQTVERLRNLLEERFPLKFHRETKEQQVYALVVAKNGPRLEQAKDGQGRMRMGRGMLTDQGAELGMLAFTLSNQLGRLVIDKTGLTGQYHFEWKWTPDPGQPATAPLGPPPPGAALPRPPDPHGPSIFTAVEEQLGLRLESQEAPVETLVIDRVETPSEN